MLSGRTLTEVQDLALDKIIAAPEPTEADMVAVLRSVQRCSRPGGELRGNNTDRKVRAAKLVAEFGDGKHCLCVYCGIALNERTLTQDRIICGQGGGRYRMNNLLPACMQCNRDRENSGADVLSFMVSVKSREGQMI